MHRVRWFVLVAGLSLLAVSTAAFVASMFQVSYRRGGPGDWTVALVVGRLDFVNGPSFSTMGLSVGGYCGLEGVRWWPRDGLWSTDAWTAGGSVAWINLPLWIPVLGGAVVAVAAWRWPGAAPLRRRPHGACASCGYDLSGLASGACPECGAQRRRLAVVPPAGPSE